MKENPVLDTIKAGGTASCFWLHFGSVPAAELLSTAGTDAIVFDLQHGLWQRDSLETAVGAVRDQAVPLARVTENSPHAIGSALDAGIVGVIVPMVETAEEAASAVAASRFAPEGRRSIGGVRPAMDLTTYVATANRRTLVAVMIETVKGLENAAEIAAVPGLDMIFIGPADLAVSLGCFAKLGPEHEAAMQTILTTCRAAGIACGLFTATPELAAKRRQEGFQLVTLGTDDGLIRAGATGSVGKYDGN